MLQGNFGIIGKHLGHNQYELQTEKYGDGYNSYFSWLQFGETTPANAVLFGGGTSASPLTSSLVGGKFAEFYTECTAESDDSRGFYWKHNLAGAGLSGESARLYTYVDGVAAATAHGFHSTLELSEGGSITGLGVGGRSNLILPSEALSGGTYAAFMAEIWANGALSDLAGTTSKSIFRVGLGGNSTGMALIEDTLNLFSFYGVSAASGNMIGAQGNEPTWASHTHLIRCAIEGDTTYYLVAITL
jgi:hypothetical protein